MKGRINGGNANYSMRIKWKVFVIWIFWKPPVTSVRWHMQIFSENVYECSWIYYINTFAGTHTPPLDTVSLFDRTCAFFPHARTHTHTHYSDILHFLLCLFLLNLILFILFLFPLYNKHTNTYIVTTLQINRYKAIFSTSFCCVSYYPKKAH